MLAPAAAGGRRAGYRPPRRTAVLGGAFDGAKAKILLAKSMGIRYNGFAERKMLM